MAGIESELKEARFDAGEVEINYAEGPDNGPPILLIHGIGGMWQNFLDVYDLIHDRWHVFAIDLRGHGKSGHTDAGYDFTDYPSDVVPFISEEITQPTVIWGHSLGAITAMGVAAKIPDLVSAAILEDPPMMIQGESSHRTAVERFRRIHEIMLAQPPDDELLSILRDMDPDRPEEHYQSRMMAIRSNDPAIYYRVVEGSAGPGWDPEAVLARVTSPTLLMQADPDFGAAVLDQHAEKAMGILSNAEHVKFPGVGHSIHAAVTQETVDVMERFVRERATARA
ncbi:MAG: alpha/beta hydrolase [Chloroflexi bacterium]|nr:alpha/beta hydrolase [Chloroflexota bacterium]